MLLIYIYHWLWQKGLLLLSRQLHGADGGKSKKRPSIFSLRVEIICTGKEVKEYFVRRGTADGLRRRKKDAEDGKGGAENEKIELVMQLLS